MRHMTVGIVLVALFTLLGISAGDAEDGPTLCCEWSRPAFGSPVDFYEVHIMAVDGGRNDTTTVHVDTSVNPPRIEYCFEGLYLRQYVYRVRGVDELGREGPWSGFYGPVDFEPGPSF